MTWIDRATAVLAENQLLARLCFATLELLVLTVLLAAFLRSWRCSSPRLVSLLWLIVLAKPVVSLAVGAPIAVVRLEAPSAAAVDGQGIWRSEVLTDSSGQRTAPRDLQPMLASVHAPVSHDSLGTTTPSGASPALRWLGNPAIEPGRFALAVWLIGVAFFLARYIVVRWRLHRVVTAAEPPPEFFRRRYEVVAGELGLSRLPDLRVTEGLDSPALVGLVRPVVLLPRWLVARGWDATAEWALRHELCHCKGLDPMAILVRDVSAILFFFHPAAWWAGRRHLEALEQACDRASLRDLSEAPAYAESLYEILLRAREERAVAWPRTVLTLAMRGRMTRRIAMLLDGSAPRPLTPLASAGAALTALTVFAFGCAVVRPEPPPAPPEHVHEDGSQPERRPSLFLFGPLSSGPYRTIADAARGGTAHVGNIWGRPHEVSIYDDLFENPSNPFRRGRGDLLALFLTLEPGGQLPTKYEDLLPSPWPEFRARLERGDTVEASGAARDMHVLALAAPTQAELETLVAESERLQSLIGSPRSDMKRHGDPASGHTHEQKDAGHAQDHGDAGHEDGALRPPDVFILGGADLAMFHKVMEHTSKGTFSKTGRDHAEAIYDELFSEAANHFDRSDGDLLVLLFSLEQGNRPPVRYEDLLPKPWAEIEASLRRGETIELSGRARGLKIVVLGAPTVAGLSRLIETTAALAPYRPAGVGAKTPPSALPAGSRYVVRFDAEDRRTAFVRLEIGAGSGELSLAMSEGAHHVEGGYAHFLHHLAVKNADGRELTLEPDGAGRFRVDLGNRPVALTYQVALDHDASPWPEGGPDEAPYATADGVFWTGRALFLTSTLGSAEVEFHLPDGWRVSTAWEPVAGQANTYRVTNRNDLTESFLFAGRHAQFKVRSVDTEVLLAVGRDMEEEGEALRDAVQRVLDAGRTLFGGTPPGRKLLVANLDSRSSPGSLNGGVFGNSISLLSGRAFDKGNLAQWAPFVAHEIVHLWNGGAAMHSADYDYWFSEGFTEYYAFVLCARLGLISREKFLDRVRGACRAYLAHAGSIPLREAGRPGRQVRALQYDGGFMAAFVLDLRLRRRTKGVHSLDDLMRAMFARDAGGTRYSLADVAALAASLAGDDLDRFFDRYVAGTEILPLEQDLAAAGLRLERDGVSEVLERKYAIHEVLRIRSLTETDAGLVVRGSVDAGYEDGDLLTEIGGRPVRTFGDVQRELAGSIPGTTVSLRILRNGTEIALPLLLGGREDPPRERSGDVRLGADIAGSTGPLEAILGQ
jgi:predicted metalloprotease with PDZ domain/beta-lactamase regulating signal transducer with metallopeptidase domain